MITSTVGLRACSSFLHIPACGNISLDAEDFFIDDLSEFSNEDIAAPINQNASCVSAFPEYTSPLHPHPHTDDNTSTISNKEPSSCVKSDSATANTSTNSVLLHGSPSALDYQSSLLIEMDSSLSLQCQDESTGLEWLTSFEDDNLILGAATNFGMDFFLSNNAEPFSGGYVDGLMKHAGYIEDESKLVFKDMAVAHNMINSAMSTHVDHGEEHGRRNRFQWDDEDGNIKLEYGAAIVLTPHSTGSRSARSKRARSSGWSSSNILCDSWENSSPTNSLNSTAQIMPNPQYQYSSAGPHDATRFMAQNQEEIDTHRNVDLVSSSLSAPRRDKPFNKATKFGSNDRALMNGWAPEDDDNNMCRDESVSNNSGLQPRRCTHCLSQKTPQWRAGPEGPKTLCNACGVRYKSGRLFDEYRPAKSPTFLSYRHSNSHKKVMEMRRRKTFQYSSSCANNNHQHQHVGAQYQARTARPLSTKHQDVDPAHVANKLKIKHNPSSSEPHSQFSDITLISTTRTALDSPSSFLY